VRKWRERNRPWTIEPVYYKITGEVIELSADEAIEFLDEEDDTR